MPFMHTLEEYGWNSHLEVQIAPHERTSVARVVQEHKEAYLVRAAGAGLGNVWAEVSGKMRHEGTVRADFPAVGDWVVLRGMEHIGFTVPDINEACDFFEKILGAETLYTAATNFRADGDWMKVHLNVDPRCVITEFRYMRCGNGTRT